MALLCASSGLGSAFGIEHLPGRFDIPAASSWQRRPSHPLGSLHSRRWGCGPRGAQTPRRHAAAAPSPGMGWRDVVAPCFNRLTGRTIKTKYFGRRPRAWNGADKLQRLPALGAQGRNGLVALHDGARYGRWALANLIYIIHDTVASCVTCHCVAMATQAVALLSQPVQLVLQRKCADCGSTSTVVAALC